MNCKDSCEILLGICFHKILFTKIWPQLCIPAPDAPPEHVECMPLSSTGLHLKWRAPPHDTWNGQIKGYRVLFVPFPKNNRMPARMNTARLSAVIGTTTTLTGLIPFTNYSVQVLAYTSAGDGDFSTSVSCSTETDGRPYIYSLYE